MHSKLVASMAPQLYGLFHVKLATLLMLIGGVPREDANGARIRGEVHMLLVGDPGTGAPEGRAGQLILPVAGWLLLLGVVLRGAELGCWHTCNQPNGWPWHAQLLCL